ncbi:MAG: oligopeptide ABC transporter, ATP-binding protein OppD [Ktedonobacterales bacterium]|jgi:oligopeptide transport system ATP-binding protein|nr:MAG: oligopeptide ABC transporter, ATP-binding protein OppD [Ktedonobacterales bacterium]
MLEVKDLKVYFRTREGNVHAVDGVSFHVDEGESLGIVGESGSGKSVTSLSIMRLLQIPPAQIMDGSSIVFQDAELVDMEESEMRKIRGRQIAMIFQDPMTSLNPVLTVERQLIEPLQLHLGLSRGEAHNRARELLEAVGIPDAERRLRSYPHQFSGGMRQRVMIAIAIAANPKLLIADEPTTALDVTVQAQILELINRLRRDLGTSVMLITHDLGVVAGMTDRIIVMYAGKIAETASTDELFANPRHPYTLGLLSAVPRLDEERPTELQTIPGSPPDQLHPIEGCPFQPRCPFVLPQCKQYPPARKIAGNHVAYCWVDVTDPEEQKRAMQRGFIPLTEIGRSYLAQS